MKIKELEDLYLHELKDLLGAETQVMEALPRMEKASTDPDLAESLAKHRAVTQEQINRLQD